MGHQINHNVYPLNCDRRKVQAELDDYAAHEDWQEGCTGLPNSIRWIESAICNNYDDALKFIDEHDSGWYDQLAVRFKEYPSLKHSAKYDKLLEQSKQISEKYRALSSTLFFKGFKAKFITCAGCKSSLNKSHLRSNRCPVCSGSMIPKAKAEQMDKLKEKLEDLKVKLEAEKRSMEQKQEKSAVIKWLVKTEFHV